jgi:hypothetical protein
MILMMMWTGGSERWKVGHGNVDALVEVIWQSEIWEIGAEDGRTPRNSMVSKLSDAIWKSSMPAQWISITEASEAEHCMGEPRP